MPDAAQGSANREIPALIADFSVALRNPRNPGETTGYQLEIPAIAVRLGGDQTASARNHLGNMSEPIRKALETQLELADYVHWFNNIRLHGTLGYLSPAEFKKTCTL